MDVAGKIFSSIAIHCGTVSPEKHLPVVKPFPKPSAPPSDELLRQARARGQGSLDAFDCLVRLNQAWVRGFLRARIRDWAAADDLAQDVFMTAYRRLGSFHGESGFEGWLRGIATNHLRNFIRKRRDQYVGGSDELQLIADESCCEWEQRAGDGDRVTALEECLKRIDGPSRQLMDQRYVIGKTVREIAEESGRGYSALTMQLHRLRESLANCVEGKVGITKS